jgi:hypothetical protein
MTAVYGASAVNRSRRTSAELAELHDAILTVCERDNPLSVRGVFYRVMSAGAVPKTEKAYAAVQREVLKLRRSGELPYKWIADSTRWRLKQSSWHDVEDALNDAAASYRRALWHDQDVYVEVWSEKEAISSIVSEVTDKWDVPLMIARGFASETFLWSTADTIQSIGKPTVIYQLGDHDKAGLDAWDAIQARLRHFAPEAEMHFERLAVTPEQIDLYSLPTRPPKIIKGEVKKNFVSWAVEVDAISTSILRSIVEEAIESWIDKDALRITRMVEEQERQGLQALLDGWTP